MTIRIGIKHGDQVLRTFTYRGASSLFIPNVGEQVISPKTGAVLHVESRTFDYGTDNLRITLHCS